MTRTEQEALQAYLDALAAQVYADAFMTFAAQAFTGMGMVTSNEAGKGEK